METTLPQEVESSLGLLIYQKARSYFENAENKAKFEEWYLLTYGTLYVWKTKVKS